MQCIKQWVMQEEMRIIFNLSSANTYWTDVLKIVSESMLVQCTTSKGQHSQFFNTTYIRKYEHGFLYRALLR